MHEAASYHKDKRQTKIITGKETTQ